MSKITIRVDRAGCLLSVEGADVELIREETPPLDPATVDRITQRMEKGIHETIQRLRSPG